MLTDASRRETRGPRMSRVIRFALDLIAYLSLSKEKVKTKRTEADILDRLHELGVRTIAPRLLRKRTVGHLGEGSFGNVVIGRLHGEKVAIKTLFAQEGTSRTDQLESVLNEVEMMNGHSHSNVMGFKGVCLAGNSVHMVMDYCPRGSLFSLLRQKGYRNLSWAFKVKLALGIARGMLFLHSQEAPIVHRDLKSPNIVLKEFCIPVIADFGMASSGQAENKKQAHNYKCQNALWLSPEVAFGEKEATTKSDVYAFGIIMWEILTAEIPWGGDHVNALCGMLNKQRPEVSQEVQEKCTGYIGADDYIALMKDCWQEAPEDRPDFGHVTDQLESILCENVGPLTFGEYEPVAH